MTRTLAIAGMTAVVIVVLGAIRYLTRSSHVDRRNVGGAGEPYSPGDPGGSAD